MFIPRRAEKTITERLQRYPAVALIGPRQAGKTTLARSIANTYFDLELEADRLRLDLRWDSLVGADDLVILDEAQAFPEIFPRLRNAIDTDRRRNGRFLLLGSVAPSLMHTVSESLAGRLALVELTPLLLAEMQPEGLNALWLSGGYPDGGILDGATDGLWHNDYLQLLCQRDLPTWGLPADAQTTARLLRMVAAVHGQQWNASRIAQSLALTHPTVNRYMDYLEGAFLLRCLRPFQTNLSKRLRKRPKYYWRDAGLLHALLRVFNYDDLLAQPWVGASWEGFVIEQIVSVAQQVDPLTEPWFFRTSDGFELDLLLEHRGQRWGFEIKLTSQPDAHDLRRLQRAAELVDADRRVLVSHAAEFAEAGDTWAGPLPEILQRLTQL